MTDNDFMELVADELHAYITAEQVPLYKKGILEIAKILNAENKKCKEIIKRTVVENFNCSDCKELGLFDKCLKKEKSCDQIVSDLFDDVISK